MPSQGPLEVRSGITPRSQRPRVDQAKQQVGCKGNLSDILRRRWLLKLVETERAGGSMVLEMIFVVAFGILGFVAAFLPRSVFPFRGRRFRDMRDNVVFELIVQFIGVVFLLVASQHIYPLLYRYL